MRTVRGEIEITSTKLDVTAPCYDASVWCRTQVDVTPGKYLYMVQIRQDCNYKVITSLTIRLKKAKGGVRFFREIGAIGVDAGLAGFFENKPDYDDEQWSRVCDKLLQAGHPTILQTTKESAFGCNGVVVSSGYGDGAYPVYEIMGENQTRLGYRIDFV